MARSSGHIDSGVVSSDIRNDTLLIGVDIAKLMAIAKSTPLEGPLPADPKATEYCEKTKLITQYIRYLVMTRYKAGCVIKTPRDGAFLINNAASYITDDKDGVCSVDTPLQLCDNLLSLASLCIRMIADCQLTLPTGHFD